MLKLSDNAVTARVKARQSRVIHAMPTSGKSTLMAMLNRSGMVIVDTDVIMETLYACEVHGTPDCKPVRKVKTGADRDFWHWNDAMRSKPEGAVLDTVKLAAAMLARQWVDAGGGVLTNLIWEPYLAGIAPSITFGVPGVIATQRSAIRAAGSDRHTGFPLELTEKWYSGWLEWAKTVPNAYVLGADDFLSDVISVDWGGPVARPPDSPVWRAIIARQRVMDIESDKGTTRRVETSSMWVYKETLRNPETGETRVTYKHASKPELYAVIKSFDPESQEKYTVKYFVGMYEKVRSHWRTLSPVDDPKARAWADKVLQQFENV